MCSSVAACFLNVASAHAATPAPRGGRIRGYRARLLCAEHARWIQSHPVHPAPSSSRSRLRKPDENRKCLGSGTVHIMLLKDCSVRRFYAKKTSSWESKQECLPELGVAALVLGKSVAIEAHELQAEARNLRGHALQQGIREVVPLRTPRFCFK